MMAVWARFEQLTSVLRTLLIVKAFKRMTGEVPSPVSGTKSWRVSHTERVLQVEVPAPSGHTEIILSGYFIRPALPRYYED
jgi:hypothetical protein